MFNLLWSLRLCLFLQFFIWSYLAWVSTNINVNRWKSIILLKPNNCELMAVIYKPLQKVWLQFEQYMNLLLFPPLPHHFWHIPSFGFKILWSFYLWRSVVPQILQVSLCMDGDRAAIVLPKLQCNAAAKGLLYLLGNNSCRLEIRAFHSSCWGELWEGVVSLQNTAGGSAASK